MSGTRKKNSQNKNTLSDSFLPLQMHVQNHQRVQNFCFYPFRKKLKENPGLQEGMWAIIAFMSKYGIVPHTTLLRFILTFHGKKAVPTTVYICSYYIFAWDGRVAASSNFTFVLLEIQLCSKTPYFSTNIMRKSENCEKLVTKLKCLCLKP